MSLNEIINATIALTDASHAAFAGVRRLTGPQTGLFPKILATSTAIGAVYFGGRAMLDAKSMHSKEESARAYAIKRLLGDSLGCGISVGGFAAAVRLAELLERGHGIRSR